MKKEEEEKQKKKNRTAIPEIKKKSKWSKIAAGTVCGSLMCV